MGNRITRTGLNESSRESFELKSRSQAELESERQRLTHVGWENHSLERWPTPRRRYPPTMSGNAIRNLASFGSMTAAQ